jgi:hypothetical protein
VLGGFIIVYAMYQLLPAVPLQASRIAAIAWGFLGGAVGLYVGGRVHTGFSQTTFVRLVSLLRLRSGLALLLK